MPVAAVRCSLGLCLHPFRCGPARARAHCDGCEQPRCADVSFLAFVRVLTINLCGLQWQGHDAMIARSCRASKCNATSMLRPLLSIMRDLLTRKTASVCVGAVAAHMVAHADSSMKDFLCLAGGLNNHQHLPALAAAALVSCACVAISHVSTPSPCPLC